MKIPFSTATCWIIGAVHPPLYSPTHKLVHTHVFTPMQHYYMLDFCYMANALLLAHCWLAPRSALLAKVSMLQVYSNVGAAFSAGTLLACEGELSGGEAGTRQGQALLAGSTQCPARKCGASGCSGTLQPLRVLIAFTSTCHICLQHWAAQLECPRLPQLQLKRI